MQAFRTLISALLCTGLSGCLEPPPDPPAPVYPDPPKVTERAPEPEPEVPQEHRHQFGPVLTPLLEKDGPGRFKNVQIVSDKLQFLAMDPGTVFSFNKFIGKRTPENGFVPADVIFEGIKQKGIGGGVCQASSTLYGAALLAGLEIIERTPHTRTVSYNKPGLDAAVSWPDQCSADDECPFIDLKFKNPHPFAISLTSEILTPEVGGGLMMGFWGDKDPGWERKLESRWQTAKHFSVIERTKPWLPDNYRKKMQAGEHGVRATLHVITLIDDKEVSRQKINSLYSPKDEVWYVR